MASIGISQTAFGVAGRHMMDGRRTFEDFEPAEFSETGPEEDLIFGNDEIDRLIPSSERDSSARFCGADRAASGRVEQGPPVQPRRRALAERRR